MRTLAILGTLALAGCSVDSMLDQVYPDGERFQFTSSAGDAVFFYICEGGPDAASRASQAHAFLDRNINALAEQAATNAISRFDEGQGSVGNAIAMNRELNTNVDIIVEQVDARYQCLFYDEREV